MCRVRVAVLAHVLSAGRIWTLLSEVKCDCSLLSFPDKENRGHNQSDIFLFIKV